MILRKHVTLNLAEDLSKLKRSRLKEIAIEDIFVNKSDLADYVILNFQHTRGVRISLSIIIESVMVIKEESVLVIIYLFQEIRLSYSFSPIQ